MAKSKRIFEIQSDRPGFKRPVIEREDDPKTKLNWRKIDRISNGVIARNNYKVCHVEVKNRDFAKWDCYMNGAHMPIVSMRFIEVMAAYTKDNFIYLPFFINDVQYFLMRAYEKIACVDLEKSDVVYGAKGSVEKIFSYKFKTSMIKDKMIFAITEFSGAYATEQIIKRSSESKLNGVFFRSTDGKAQYYP